MLESIIMQEGYIFFLYISFQNSIKCGPENIEKVNESVWVVPFWNLFKLFYALIWRNSLTGIFYLLGLYYFSYTGHHPPPLSHLFSFLLQMIEVLITDCSSLYLEKWNIKQIGCCQPAALNFLLCQHQSIFRLRGWHSFEILFVSDLIFQSSSRRVVVVGRLPFPKEVYEIYLSYKF